MFLIFGLGNPEKDYKGTRHNVGFEVINKLAYDRQIDLNRAKFRAHFGEGRFSAHKVMLIKPQTFMNLSGECVREMIEYYNVPAEDIIVIYDDISLDIGTIRIRRGGSAGTHNGMRNIIHRLGRDDFCRIRIGIGDKPPGWDLADYVLSKFKPDETPYIIDGITKAGDAVISVIEDGVNEAMNKFNGKAN